MMLVLYACLGGFSRGLMGRLDGFLMYSPIIPTTTTIYLAGNEPVHFLNIYTRVREEDS